MAKDRTHLSARGRMLAFGDAVSVWLHDEQACIWSEGLVEARCALRAAAHAPLRGTLFTLEPAGTYAAQQALHRALEAGGSDEGALAELGDAAALEKMPEFVGISTDGGRPYMLDTDCRRYT